MTVDKKKRPMIEVTDAARYRFKAVAALRGITMRDLIEQTAKDLADGAGVVLPPSIPETASKGNAPVE